MNDLDQLLALAERLREPGLEARGGDARMSFAQERLWLVDQLGLAGGAYNVARVLTLHGPLDVTALDRALRTIVARHEVLRARLAVVDGEPRMLVGDGRDFALRVVEDADVEAEVRGPFNLAAGGLLRALLVRRAPREHMLALTVHHIVCDGWSLAVLMRELRALYAGEALAPLPAQYADFARRQRAAPDALLAHWRARLAGLAPVLELPSDRPRPVTQSFRGGALRFRAPTVQAPGMTRFVPLVAAFAVVLGRWTNRTDVAFGTPVAGRSSPEVEELIGCFVNLLVLRVDLSGDPTVGALLERAREVALDAQDHAELPFERLVEALAPERSLAHPPLVQAALVFHNTPDETPALDGLQVRSHPVDPDTSKFDLTLSLAKSGDGLIEYSTDLFDRATMERFAAHFVTVLDALCDPGRRVSSIALEAVELDATARPIPDACLHERFEAQVDRTPGAVALRFGDEALTYAELDRRANRLAHRLIARGVGREVLVGLALERSLDVVVAMLGVLKAGGSYVPLDPALPRERRDFILADCGATVVLDALDDVPGDEARLGRLAEPSNVAYVIYTSGSTGAPKGVVLEHRGVVSLVEWAREAVGDAVARPWTVFHSFGFDFSVWETFAPLCHGGTAVIVASDVRAPESFVELLERERIAVLSLTPSGIRMLTSDAAPWQAASELALEAVIIGGEALEAGHVPDWFHALLPSGIQNLFGITEITVHATAAPVHAGAPVAIGGPIANTRVYLLDDHLQPVPENVVGELYIGGAGVARGYLGRPALTAERFVPDPFTPGRLYRTGDLARRRDGTLEFAGRRDRQIKLRGYRIEPREIEARLGDALVVVRDARLVAYTRAAVDLDRLRAVLPDYMVPSAVVVVDAWPLTANGKIDEAALPAPRAAAPAPAPDGTPLAELVAGQMAAVLARPAVGLDEDFFAAGGDSLLATRLVARLRSAAGVDLALRQVFATPTARGLAAGLEAAPQATPPIPARGGGTAPMAFAQARLWLVEELGAGPGAYNVPRVWRLRGALDVLRLEAALRAIVARHDVLRARFALVDGEPTMQVTEDDFTLRVGGPELRDDFRRPFALASEPPVRAVLVREGPDEHLLALTLHHIICDGWSIGVLEHELRALYSGETLPPLPLQYGDYARWQRGRLSGAALERRRERLAGLAPVLELASDRPRPPVQSFRGVHARIGVAAAPLHAIARERGVTPFMVMLAGYAIVLGRWSGRLDVPIGSPTAGRPRVELEELMGFFVNTLVLRVDLSGDPTVGELLARVRETALDAHRDAELPFERLVEALAPERSLAYTPLIQVLFVLQNAPREGPALPGLDVSLAPVATGTSKFDLTLYAEVGETEITFTLNGAADLFDAATLERFAAELAAVLDELGDADTRLSALAAPVAPVPDDDALTRALREIIESYDAKR